MTVHTLHGFARGIVDTIRQPLVILDQQLRVIQANEPFYETFQVSAAETEGTVIYRLGNGEWDVPELRALLDAVIPQNGSFAGFQLHHSVPATGPRVMKLNARRVHDDGGTPVVLLTMEDVTEQVRARDLLHSINSELEQRVQERTAALAAANQELEAFSYSVSHDLRAPLRSIAGFSEEILRSYHAQLDDRGRHYLERICAGTERMGSLIDHLLRLSRLTRGDIERARVDLTAIASGIADELRTSEPQRDVEISIAPGLYAWADAPLIRVALENLFANAWKFTARRASASIAFTCRDTADGQTFCVEDNGVGFAMAHANRLFGAFQRLHPEREFPGTGVGLATVQRIVRRHGGRIWAEGAEGQGARFFFTLPQETD